jgi:predicted alpha/beta superfamily hydrolase
MKKIILSFTLIILSFCATAQKNNKIEIGTIDSVYSKILKEQRKILIHIPNSAQNGLFSKQRYPVVYLLDGDGHFNSIVGMIEQLSAMGGNTSFPEMIVVGISNTDRMRDLTPTHINSDLPMVDSIVAKNTGGGEKFISFIEKELMPHIDSLYPTEPYRMLIGHSLGGLTVMNTFIHHTNLFNAYVAIDPSMWWDNKKLLKETKNALATTKYPNVSLFLGIANTMEKGMDITKVKKETSDNTKHIRSILELDNDLSLNNQNQLKYQSKYYNDDDHNSVTLITEYDALRFIFDYYKLKLTTSDYMNINKALISKIETHYKDMSKKFGYEVKVPESLINNLGYQALGSKHFEEAESLFKLNVANYPESFNVYDSLGDFYDAKKDKANAINLYKKALAIKEFPETRKKLDNLQMN